MFIPSGVSVRETHRIHHQGVAVPVPDGVAVVGEIGIVGMRAAVGVNVPNLHVRFGDHGDHARRVQDLDGIWLAHDSRHSGRHAVGLRRIVRRIGLEGLEHGCILRRERELLRRGEPPPRPKVISQTPFMSGNCAMEAHVPPGNLLASAAMHGASGERD